MPIQTRLRIVGSYCSKFAQQKKLIIEARDNTVEENHITANEQRF